MLTIALIEFATPEYDEAVALRDLVLRKPLGLEFTPEQLALEYNQYHLAAFAAHGRIVGCLSLVPVETDKLKMRQVAVHPDVQTSGIGSALVSESERFARANGFRHIELHARDTAVPFYEKLGYEKEGELFEEVGIPHWAMRKSL